MGRFSILILTIGIPGSGKTTWINEYKKTHPLTHVVSTDHIRLEITGVEQCIDPSQNDMIHEEARKRTKILLDTPTQYSLGPEVIVDSTNVELEEWLKYKALGPSIIIAKLFNTDPETAMKYQEGRERKVPLDILQMKWDKLQQNKQFLNCVFNLIW